MNFDLRLDVGYEPIFSYMKTIRRGANVNDELYASLMRHLKTYGKFKESLVEEVV